MQVVDWATLIQRRNDPALWDIYITHCRSARADADAAAARRRRARLVELAGEGRGAGRLQRRGRSRRSAAPSGARCSQVVYDRGAVHPGRQLQQPVGATRQARRLRRDAVAVLLEHGPASKREIAARCTGSSRSRFAGHGWWCCCSSRIAGLRSSRALAPGDPAAVMLGDQATAADIAQLRASYGLDKPLPVQFAYWLRRAGARQSRPVDLPAAAGDAGAARSAPSRRSS